MKMIITKKTRWNESCNWQLESIVEKEISESDLPEIREYILSGCVHNAFYDEYYRVYENTLTVYKIVR